MKKFEKYLQTKEGSLKSNVELEKIMRNKIVIINRKMSDGTYIRIFNYKEEFGIFGTLEGKWTIIQVYNEKVVFAKIIFENSCETATGIISECLNSKSYFIIYGYSSIYRPMPVFLSSFKIENGKYSNCDILEKIKIDSTLTIENSDNYILITGKDEDGLDIENIENSDFLALKDGEKNYKFLIKGGKIVLIK